MRHLVAVLGNHAEIVLAHVNRESPKSAALPFPKDLIRSATVAMVVSLWGVDGNPFDGLGLSPESPLCP